MPRRPIILAVAVAIATTAALLVLVRVAPPGGQASGRDGSDDRVAVGQPVPPIVGTTLDGGAFDLAAFKGKPVLVNFWGPSCVPCRDEFPLIEAKLVEHAADGLVVVGVLTDDPVEPAREFVGRYGGTWPTVVDPDKSIKSAYRVAARPQTYFVDRAGVLRSIQIGEMRDADFERQYAQIAR
jgi:cytochrome c biogenesis protein CcmG/thiol:disulfide interchange protein DsbE